MRNFLFILSFLFVVSCSQNQSDNSTSPEKVNADEFKMEKIAGTGIDKAVQYGKEGEIVSEGYLKDGLKTGQWVEFNNEGKVVSIISYLGGKLNGYYFEFDDRGNLVSQAKFKNDKLDGRVLKIKYGRTEEILTFKDGKLNGLRTKYNRSGKAIQETEYKDDKKHGYDRYFSEEGVLEHEYQYKNGKQVGGGRVQNKKEK